MGTFVKPGANVIIKPNICVAYRSYDQAATTNPWVVGALVKLCFEAGAGRVRVMDSPFDGTASRLTNIRIQEQVEANGGRDGSHVRDQIYRNEYPGRNGYLSQPPSMMRS